MLSFSLSGRQNCLRRSATSLLRSCQRWTDPKRSREICRCRVVEEEGGASYLFSHWRKQSAVTIQIAEMQIFFSFLLRGGRGGGGGGSKLYIVLWSSRRYMWTLAGTKKKKEKHLILLNLLQHLKDFFFSSSRITVTAVSVSTCFNETVVSYQVWNLPKHKQGTRGQKPFAKLRLKEKICHRGKKRSPHKHCYLLNKELCQDNFNTFSAVIFLLPCKVTFQHSPPWMGFYPQSFRPHTFCCIAVKSTRKHDGCNSCLCFDINKKNLFMCAAVIRLDLKQAAAGLSSFTPFPSTWAQASCAHKK